MNGRPSIDVRVTGETWTLVSVSREPGGEVVIVEARKKPMLLAAILGARGKTTRLAFLWSGREWRRLPSLERCGDETQAALLELLAAHRRENAGARTPSDRKS